MKKKPGASRAAGTYSAKDILLNRREPIDWSTLNKKLAANNKTYIVACFLRINMPNVRAKWKQGTLTLSKDSAAWRAFWRKQAPPINLTSDYNLTKLTWRPATLTEALLKLKPQFVVLHVSVEGGSIECAVPRADVPLFVHRLMRLCGSSLEVQKDLKDTIAKSLPEHEGVS